MTGLPAQRNGLTLSIDVSATGQRSALRRALTDGNLVRVRRGVYATRGERPDPAERDRLRYAQMVQAVGATHGRPVFTGASAALLLGLPMIGRWPDDVYLLSRTRHGRRRNGVIELASRGHETMIAVDDADCTTVAVTLIHACRTTHFLSALGTVDAALHVSRDGRPPLCTLEQLWAEHVRRLPYPGSVRVERVLGFASTQAESPLETLSRLSIHELGFPAPELQHRIQVPSIGRAFDVDFYWRAQDLVGEADGHGKYRDGGASDPVDVVIREKDRENELRGMTGGFVRWDWADAWHRTGLERTLTRAGLPRLRRPRFQPRPLLPA